MMAPLYDAGHRIEVEADDTGIALYWREDGDINAIFRILVEWIREAEGLSSIETLELRALSLRAAAESICPRSPRASRTSFRPYAPVC